MKLIHEGNRAVIIVEQCLRDMLIESLSTNTNMVIEDLDRSRTMILDIAEVQREWRDVLDHVNFALPGEYEKDAIFVYDSTTNALAHIDRTVSEAMGTVVGLERLLTQNQISLEKPKYDLTNLLESVHSNIDSILLACPRLSLLPYNKLRAAMRMWHATV